MRLVHISDTHGKHRELSLPGGEFLVHSGDFSEYGIDVETHAFLNWFRVQPFKHRIFIGGNHDEDLANNPKQFDFTGINYLNNSSVELEGIKFYGSGASPSEFNMPFTYLPNEANWSHIPDNTEILITHTPVYGICDDSLGCKTLKERIDELDNLKMHLAGHIHQAHGMHKRNGVLFSNAATVINVISI
ncbi:metallophosphoesterase family protein [Thiomicrorhabdus chilensis]|uniref:metallophosphoesterase family protein n=1 Tax=Thiomicrorhabdus chilensis TaxID=63656 RepID=UPI00048D4AA1|nr:metallophosphatase domain-containing protein [Thiomicrorhabdus chilensis]